MKTIAIVTNGATPLGAFLKGNLEEVLAGYVEINLYALNELAQPARLEEDVVLVMLKSKVLEVEGYVPDTSRILVVQRTVREGAVEPLLSLPEGTRVLVVNDAPETTLETVAFLYQVGLRHLRLIPYDPDKPVDCLLATTPGEAHLVPPPISMIVDLGNRVIDISTFLEIINRLGLECAEVSRRLVLYAESTVNVAGGIKEQQRQLFLQKAQLESVVDLAKEGLLLLDVQGRILVANAAMRDLLKLEGDACLGRKAAKVLPAPLAALLPGDDVRGEVVELAGRELLAGKQTILQFGAPAGCCFSVQDITYLRQLEKTKERRLRSQGLTARYCFEDIRTQVPRMRECLQLAERMAASGLTVLIAGESGTGKELLAQSIHNASPRKHQPFVAVNCAAVPEALLESELFGYEGGAFTGALREGKRGLFEQAHGGTVFLDEVGDMPLALQARLLRVLQEKQLTRLGSSQVLNVDIRVVAATHLDLRQLVEVGRFRQDLYYRLHVLPLVVPPLRERREDILPLLAFFLSEQGRSQLKLEEAAKTALLAYSWPGNIRELQNVAAYAAFAAGERIGEVDLPYYVRETPQEEEVFRRHSDWPLAQKMLAYLAAGSAGRNTLANKLQEAGEECSEGEVRRLLAWLQQWGLVEAQTGRGGSRLTARGLAAAKNAGKPVGI